MSAASGEIDRLNGETIAAFRAGRYQEAISHARRATDLCRAHFGPDHPQLATSLNNLGVLHRELGELSASLACITEAVEIDRRTRRADDPSLAVSLNELALLHKSMGNFAAAEPLYSESIEIRRKAHGDQSEEYAKSVNNLALLYDAMGDYPRAEPLLRQALALARARGDHTSAETAETVNNLAGVCYERGSYAEAEGLYREALALLPAVIGPGHPRVALAMQNLGAVYRALGNHEEAGRLYAEAAQRIRASLGERHPLFANAVNSLGIFFADEGLYEPAADALTWAAELRRATLGESHPDLIATLVSLGTIEIGAKRYGDARAHYDEALEISTRALGYEEPLALQGLAGVAYENGRYDEAEALTRRALEQLRVRRGADHPDVALGLEKLALLAAARGRHEDALALLTETSTLNDRLMAQVFSLASESHRLQFLGGLRRHLDFTLSLVSRHLSGNTAAVRTALDLVLRRKGLSAEALAAQRDAVLGGRYPHLEAKLRELTNLRRQAARARLGGTGGAAAATAHHEQLRDWDAAMRGLEQELAREIPELRLEERLRAADRSAVALALPEGAALIEFARFNRFDFGAVAAEGGSSWGPAEYVALVMRSGNPDSVHLVNLGAAEPIDRLVATFRSAITGMDGDRGARDLGALAPDAAAGSDLSSGAHLTGLLFAPIEAALGGASRLIVCPDADLTRLPFEVLPSRDGGRVIDRYQVSYAGSGRDVLRWSAPAAVAAADPIVAADPDFDLASDGSLRHEAEPAAARSLRDAGVSFGRLPGTRGEGERVAELLGARPWLGGTALEGRIKRLSSPRILHIATHGYFLPNVPLREERGAPLAPGSERSLGAGEGNPLLRSGLALAAANTWLRGGTPPDAAEDGVLTAEDVSGLDLAGTELVVLSACETGLGEVHRGEGVFGLQRAFTVAGARTLIMSLWKVPDEQTKDLMESFYRALLAGRPRAEALREAQLAIRSRWPEPFYWGAFVCQGNPGPV